MIPGEPQKVRFNEKLDHLQAKRPFTYNLVTGAVISGLLVLVFSLPWAVALLYTLSWAGLRWYLWRDGKILRRQYETRVVRVAAEKEADKDAPPDA